MAWIAALACLALPVHASDGTVGAGQRRVALVIGNANYRDSPLKNPLNDANDMARKLRELGFRVLLRENLTQRQIGSTLREFRRAINPGDDAMFFYAGHGLQVKGVNYLPAVDADISSEEDVPQQAINLNNVLELLDESKAGVKLVFLDACRNNPYARSFRSAATGLSRLGAAPAGTLISFATRPGSVAADGEGRNGLYTSQLLKHIDTPNTLIEQMLKRVSMEVESVSGGRQEPWMEGGIRGDFYFRGQGTALPVLPAVTTPALPTNVAVVPAPSVERMEPSRRTPVVSSSDPDAALWQAVEAGGSADDYEVYLKQFPKGKYAALARQRLQKSRDDARDRSQAAETSAWQTAENAQSLAGYETYLATYPQGRYAQLAQSRVSRLRQESIQREEDGLWQQATTLAGVQAYLNRYPNGRYSVAAQTRKEQLNSFKPNGHQIDSPPGFQKFVFFCTGERSEASERDRNPNWKMWKSCSAEDWAVDVPWSGINLDKVRERSDASDAFNDQVYKLGYKDKAKRFCEAKGYKEAAGWPLAAWARDWKRRCPDTGQPASPSPLRTSDSTSSNAPSAAPFAVFPVGDKLTLAKDKGCVACHAVDRKLVGPAFVDVARKYRSATDHSRLISKVMRGGSGVWGPIPMPANTGVSEDEVKTLLRWILTMP